ncbi:DUF4136 domain-containing protein [Thiomonas sp.]
MRDFVHFLRRQVGLAAILIPALLLGGCASLTDLRATVVTPNPAPQALIGAKVQVQAAPSNAESADAYTLQTAVLDAMTQAGMVPVLGAPAPYTARYTYTLRLDLEATYGPSVWPPPVLLPNGAVYFPGGYAGWGGGWFGWMPPPNYYDRSLSLEIRDSATGALIWQSHASIGGYERGLASVAVPLAQAALRGFPSEYGEHKVLFPR